MVSQVLTKERHWSIVCCSLHNTPKNIYSIGPIYGRTHWIGRHGGTGKDKANRAGLAKYIYASLQANKPYNQIVREHSSHR